MMRMNSGRKTLNDKTHHNDNNIKYYRQNFNGSTTNGETKVHNRDNKIINTHKHKYSVHHANSNEMLLFSRNIRKTNDDNWFILTYAIQLKLIQSNLYSNLNKHFDKNETYSETINIKTIKMVYDVTHKLSSIGFSQNTKRKQEEF